MGGPSLTPPCYGENRFRRFQEVSSFKSFQVSRVFKFQEFSSFRFQVSGFKFQVSSFKRDLWVMNIGSGWKPALWVTVGKCVSICLRVATKPSQLAGSQYPTWAMSSECCVQLYGFTSVSVPCPVKRIEIPPNVWRFQIFFVPLLPKI